MKYLYVIIISIVLFGSCQTKQDNPAISVKEAKGLTGVYSKFDQIEYHFRKDTDTAYIINFWATWCKPCVKELPYFEKIGEEYKGKKIKLLFVSLDFKKSIDKKLKPFLKENLLDYEVIAIIDSDYNSWIDKVSPEWTGSIPATYIYKKEKNGFYEQSFSYEELKKTLEEYL